MRSNDWLKFEEIVNEKNDAEFAKLFLYWQSTGAEKAYNTARNEIRVLSGVPQFVLKGETSEYGRLITEYEIFIDEKDIYKKIVKLLDEAIEKGEKSDIKKLSRLLFLLGERVATTEMQEKIEKCENTINQRYTDSLVRAVELQEEMDLHKYRK